MIFFFQVQVPVVHFDIRIFFFIKVSLSFFFRACTNNHLFPKNSILPNVYRKEDIDTLTVACPRLPDTIQQNIDDNNCAYYNLRLVLYVKMDDTFKKKNAGNRMQYISASINKRNEKNNIDFFTVIEDFFLILLNKYL